MGGKLKPVVVVTGASGAIGATLCRALEEDYRVVRLDLEAPRGVADFFACDVSSPESVTLAFLRIRQNCGGKLAAVIHLAAYFDFTGEENPLYKKVNVEGTRNILRELRGFRVERFMYASTMLVHEPGVPGRKITEDTPLKPAWAYPRSKAEAEEAIEKEHGAVPFTILRLAGVYDDGTAVPTLSCQIARIYEREFKSYLYSGDLMAGQAFLHIDDLCDLFLRVVERRGDLPARNHMLAGESAVMGYKELQNRIGELVFGAREWPTISLPKSVAKPGAWLEEKTEPLVPDAIDQGEKPFVRPFMIDLASDHYELDISRARGLLDWEPRHNIHEGLARLVASLKKDPAAWYRKNGITPPDWVLVADERHENADKIRHTHEANYRRQHQAGLWAHFLNLGMASWLVTAPFIVGYPSRAMILSDMISGAVLAVFALLSLSWRWGLARWACALVGFWLLFAPLFFWAPTAAEYLNDTLVGMLVIGFAVLTRPTPGVAAAAAMTGPAIPPGWKYSPSSWFQRLPIIILACVGLFVSRYLAAYQLGHVETVWEPFFPGSAADPKNGTEEIITSSVSQAWPVSDAGIGAVTYALEIVTGIIGSARRWRTIPWLVTLFGVMIVPLGVVSIFFIIIQPIWIGTWCTLCLIAAAAMLIQIPYSVDELVATGLFLYRRKKKGRPLLRVFFMGDTDEGETATADDDFGQPPCRIVKEMLSGGITLPWTLILCMAIGAWLMFTRLTLGAEGSMADADHLTGALVVTIAITALAESARATRFLIIPFGLALLVTPFLFGAGLASLVSSILCGAALVALSIPRGRIVNSYGAWDRYIV